MTKVTSLGSTSGVPTPPNPTPCTEWADAIDDAGGGQPDLEALGSILGPIQEDLNEKADVAMLPTPPINSPAFSPAPSVYRAARTRGFSNLGDRLLQLKLEERSSPRKDSDGASSSRSEAASIPEDDRESIEDGASSAGRSTGNRGASRLARNKASDPLISPALVSPTPGAIPIALGSARLNPRIEEYVQFSSKDLPVIEPVKEDAVSTQAVSENDHAHARCVSVDTLKTDHSGVTEKSTWAEEVEDAAERSFLRLEQLAKDESTIDPKFTMEEYYVQRLQRLFKKHYRQVKVEVSLDTSEEGPSTQEVAEEVEGITQN